MKTQLAIWAGKLTRVISRFAGHGGSTIPGVVARKLDAKILRHLRSMAEVILYITGTNGKTTTSNLISHLLETNGKKVISNREGANMVTGISTCIIQNAPLFGLKKFDVAVIEVDEASLPKVISECPSDYLLITNFFRDQLDRYGEIDLLIKKMKNSLLPFSGKLIINADDPFSYRFSDLQKENLFVGFERGAFQLDSYSLTESKYCPNCQNELQYKNVHFGHLGYYECDCGFKRPDTNTSVEKVHQDTQGMNLVINGEQYQTFFRGMYNAYNALFAVQSCFLLGLKSLDLKKGLLTYHNPKGRMQEFLLNGKPWLVNLVKNPAGGNVTLSDFFHDNEKKQLIFCLNDYPADGEDISWIWDMDMEIANRNQLQLFIASGKRAHDAALRMKYTGYPQEKIKILPEMEKAVQYAKQKGYSTYIMATYTCISKMVSILENEEKKQKEGVKNFGTLVVSLFPRHIKSIWRRGKYNLFKKTLQMEGHFAQSRRNQKNRERE